MPLDPDRDDGPARTSEESEEEDLLSEKVLVFTLGEELYGCPLLKVKEVIKPSRIKPVPYMTPSFKGVLNLRGHVLGIIDLGERLRIPRPASLQGLIIVAETHHGPIGVMVDDLAAVVSFTPQDTDPKTPIETRLRSEFFDGMGKWNDRLVHLINLSGLLEDEDFRAMRAS